MKEQFLLGWEIDFKNTEHLESFMSMQATSKDIAGLIGTYLHLTYDDNLLLQNVELYFDNEKDTDDILKDRNVYEAIGKFQYKELPIHEPQCVIYTNTGLHYLGGAIPQDFSLPPTKLQVPCQYLGYISNQDSFFSWLPFSLHLIAPIYLNFDILFIDYSNPLEPVIINEQDLIKTDSSYDFMHSETLIEFQKKNFSIKDTLTDEEENQFIYDIHVGIPFWVQYPMCPRCPKTNKIMKFVGQLRGGIPTEKHNLNNLQEWETKHIEELNFWGDGDLYIFFQPETKVACYLIQNT